MLKTNVDVEKVFTSDAVMSRYRTDEDQLWLWWIYFDVTRVIYDSIFSARIPNVL